MPWCLSALLTRSKAKFSVSGDSSAEAEYAAAAGTAKELVFVRNILSDMNYPVHGPVVMAVDNSAAIDVGKDKGVTKRNLHWERVSHYVRHAIMHLRVEMVWVDTDHQMADFHTKILNYARFMRCRDYHLHRVYGSTSYFDVQDSSDDKYTDAMKRLAYL